MSSVGGLKLDWSRITAFFGGTFDPPHLGHREAAEGLFRTPGVGRVRVLPSGAPPWKSGGTSALHRLALTRLAFENSRAEVDARELQRAASQPGEATTTFDTLLEARQELGPELAFVIGTDQLLSLDRWYRFPEVLGLAHWIVLERRGDDDRPSGTHPLAALGQWEAAGLARRVSGTQGLPEFVLNPSRLGGGGTAMTHIVIAPTPARSLSSTSIREALGRTGKAPEGALAAEVEAYIQSHKLYG